MGYQKRRRLIGREKGNPPHFSLSFSFRDISRCLASYQNLSPFRSHFDKASPFILGPSSSVSFGIPRCPLRSFITETLSLLLQRSLQGSLNFAGVAFPGSLPKISGLSSCGYLPCPGETFSNSGFFSSVLRSHPSAAIPAVRGDILSLFETLLIFFDFFLLLVPRVSSFFSVSLVIDVFSDR